MKYREDVDALRGLSIFLVVIFHFFPKMLPGGYVGVDVFFVISGFIITTLIRIEIDNNSFSLRGFYARRVRRLAPALIFVLSFLLLFGWFFLFEDEYALLGKHVFSSVLIHQNFNLVEELGYFDVGAHYKQLLHFWSLSIEEQYYIFWPALLLIFCRRSISPSIFLYFVSVSSFGYLVFSSSQSDSGAFFHSSTRIWELSLGSLLALNGRDVREKYAKPIFLFGLCMILFSSLIFDGEIDNLAYYTLIPVLGAILMISSKIVLPSWGGFLWLGKISYPLYLWHWALLSSAYIYLGHLPSNTTLAALIVVSLAISVFSNRYIEKIRHSSSRFIVPTLTLSMLLIAIIGWVIDDNGGFPDRKHLDYIGEKIQFERTPAKDPECLEFAERGLGSSSLFHYCRSDMSGNRKIVAIIGDSHGHALYPGVQQYAEKHGMDSLLFANSSCPPLIGFEWGRNTDEISRCKESIDQIFTLIEHEKRIRKVIIVTRGPVYIHGETPGKATKASVSEGLAAYKDPSRFSYDSYFSGLSESINRLASMAHVEKIYYMLENPELDFQPKDAIPRPFDYFNISSEELRVSRKLFDYRMANYREGVLRVGAALPSMKIVDVTPLLCEKEYCRVFEGGISLYADDDHFSVFGSRYILQGLESEIFE